MILTFSKEQFVQSIIEGQKIHTFREDKHNRWKPGMKIHFWKGNPRNTKNNPYQFAEGIVKEVKPVVITYVGGPFFKVPEIYLGGELVTNLPLLAFQDGFNSVKSFCTWFDEDWKGYAIYWDPKEIKVLL